MVTVFQKRMEVYGTDAVTALMGLMYVTEYGLKDQELKEILKAQFKIDLDTIEMASVLGSVRSFLVENECRLKWNHEYVFKAMSLLLTDDEGLKYYLSRADVFIVANKEQDYRVAMAYMMNIYKWHQEIVISLNHQNHVIIDSGNRGHLLEYMMAYGMRNDAVDLAESIYEQRKQVLGKNHKDTLATLKQLNELLIESQQKDQIS